MSKYRVCALGNSHLGAAKRGWDQIAGDFPGFEVDFFGFPPGSSSRFASHLEVVDRAIVAVSEKLKRGFELTAGRTRVEGPEYSAFITFGLGIPGPTDVTRRICATHQPFVGAFNGAQLVSKACLAATFEDYFASDRMLTPFKTLRAVSHAPVFFQSTPAPMASIAGNPAYADDPCSIPGLVRAVRPIFDAQCEEAGRGELYTYVSQPGKSIDETGLTKDEFISDGVGFGAFKGRTKGVNVSHGNQNYGALVMRELLGRLREHPGLHPR